LSAFGDAVSAKIGVTNKIDASMVNKVVFTNRFGDKLSLFKADLLQKLLIHKGISFLKIQLLYTPADWKGYTSDNQFIQKPPFLQAKNPYRELSGAIKSCFTAQRPILSHTTILKSSNLFGWQLAGYGKVRKKLPFSGVKMGNLQ
jgi:hypothetical protein